MTRLIPILLFLCLILAGCSRTLQPIQSSDYSTEPRVTAPVGTSVTVKTTPMADGFISVDIDWEPTD